MSEPRHTPGPWRLVGVDGGGPLSIMTTAEAPTKAEYVSDTGYSLADAADLGEWDSLVADHRLMAAAPEMLFALVRLADGIEIADSRRCCSLCGTLAVHADKCPIAVARAAITKARGET